MNKKLLNEIERIKILISEETLYGRQIDKPSLITEDWKKILIDALTKVGKEADEVDNILSDISVILKNTDVGSIINSKVKNMDSKTFTTYINGDDFIDDLKKSKGVFTSDDFVRKLADLGIKSDEIIGSLETKHDEYIKRLKEFFDGGGSIPETSTKTIFEPLNLDDAFIKKYNEVFNTKKSGFISKNVDTLIDTQPALKKDLQSLKNISVKSKIFSKLKDLYLLKGVKPYDGWKAHMVGVDWKIKSPIKSLNKDSVYGQFVHSLPLDGRKTSWFNFGKTNPSLAKALGKFLFSGYSVYGPSFYAWYLTLWILRYAAEGTYCKKFKKNIDPSTVVESYNIEIDNIFTKLINEQESKSHFEKGIDIDWDVVLEYLNYFKHVTLSATGLPLTGLEVSYDPGSLVNMPLFTTEICTLDKDSDMVKSHDEHKLMLDIIMKNDLCIPTQKYLDIDEDKKPIVLTKGEHFVCGKDIEKDLEAWKIKISTDLKEIFSDIKLSDLKSMKGEMKEIEEGLNKIILYNQNGNSVTYKSNKELWKKLFTEAVKSNKILSNMISQLK